MMDKILKYLRKAMSWLGWKTPAEEARAWMLETGRNIPLECFHDNGFIDVDKLSAHVAAMPVEDLINLRCGKEQRSGVLWFAWHPVKLETGSWAWLKNVWRTRDDFLCRAPNGVIEYWEKR